jgi:hypothetical protein
MNLGRVRWGCGKIGFPCNGAHRRPNPQSFESIGWVYVSNLTRSKDFGNASTQSSKDWGGSICGVTCKWMMGGRVCLNLAGAVQARHEGHCEGEDRLHELIGRFDEFYIWSHIVNTDA